ncbi:TlpA family protein disulfide reductase [Campylobacter insulaenigrae]|uniref:TlpA family protein disulfide reductase n=1 Tax=Campylobacter insulaenigrae TaxID=260714 RepID=A0ABY3G4W5_9BACT|nr:TlpA disulfide reductase family protein [Campylobacter insulaenigrae]MCR6570702.1 TlpA family protein disulfide reductase [Campylobacter insulaenigrae]MCR6573877.1 TlpA family protein disulfide reductase [Campylobacter insulaenigrae]MCR6575060.1 TlpA family protein disulfide reductase [Campylobacter insulaenigrae]MCR6577398.1 TlpA family protein disulfide reductase [Campylobacter insulaenigrae]MCR6580596.1 TlpA family protein disulfide reductase [Campylobacter insulaenigrae]
MKINFFLVIFILVFFSACSSEKEDTQEMNGASLTQSENVHFTLKFLDDKKLFVNYQDQKFDFDDNSKAKLFVFFTSWCIPCKAEIAHLNNLHRKYKDGLDIIVLFLEENKDKEILEFIQENKITFQAGSGENSLIFSKILNIGSIPAMVLFDTKGQKIKEYLGLIPEEMLDIDIQKVIM